MKVIYYSECQLWQTSRGALAKLAQQNKKNERKNRDTRKKRKRELILEDSVYLKTL